MSGGRPLEIMILTVTLNPCVHHILAYEPSADGKRVVKPVRSFFQPGGKGLNAARVIAALGTEVLALTTWGNEEGRLLLREVGYSGVAIRALEVSRPTRISTLVYNLQAETFIELLEPGVELSEAELDGLFKLFEESLAGVSLVALNGSSPCRAADDFFQRAAERAHRAGCCVVVDSYSAPLVNALRSAPDLVKLNRDEIRISFGLEVRGEEDLPPFVRRLNDQGIRDVLVTDGPRGAWLFTAGESFRVQAPRVRELHAIGSGDAMLGAMLARLEQGDSMEEACRWGAAAGAVNASRLEVCQFPPSMLEDLLPSVRVEPFHPPAA